ncbi:MAG: hypothetical protein KGI71_05025 [Patescibacteria group bacterium]|nr:hypothetical protein [Patescibacteria group bacterium]
MDRGGLTADTDGSRVLVADVESGGEDGPDVWLGVNGREVLNATTDESFARATLNPGWTLVRYIPAARLRELSVDLHDRMSTHARQSAALFRAGQERDAERAARERAEQPLAAVTAQRPGWMMTTCECPRPTVSAYCQVCGYGLPPDPRDAELSALRAEVAALRKVESAARAWGRSHTPAGWTDEEHAATPHVNLRTKWDDALADALRALDATDAKGGA